MILLIVSILESEQWQNGIKYNQYVPTVLPPDVICTDISSLQLSPTAG